MGDCHVRFCERLIMQKFGLLDYLYAAGSDDCKWDINKGIYMGGKVGCGKTILMHSFCEILHFISGKTVEMIAAPDLCRLIAEKGFEPFATRPIRYNKGARTFFTSNFRVGSLSKWRDESGTLIGYGQDIGDRIREMMNIVELPGESRREISAK